MKLELLWHFSTYYYGVCTISFHVEEACQLEPYFQIYILLRCLHYFVPCGSLPAGTLFLNLQLMVPLWPISKWNQVNLCVHNLYAASSTIQKSAKICSPILIKTQKEGKTKHQICVSLFYLCSQHSLPLLLQHHLPPPPTASLWIFWQMSAWFHLFPTSLSIIQEQGPLKHCHLDCKSLLLLLLLLL